MDIKILNLSDVVFFQEGPGVRKFQFKDEGVKLLNVGNINNGILDTSTTKLYVSEEEAFGKYKHFLLDEGDLIIASSGIVVDNFHNKIAYVEKRHLPLCLNTSTIRFKSLDSNKFSLDYLKFYLKTNHFKLQLKRLVTGSAQLNFGPSHLKQIMLPVPSLKTQLHIANTLTKAESLIVDRKESICLLDEYMKNTFLEMFGDPVRNENVWEIKILGNICDVGSSKRVFVEELVDSGIPFYRGTEIGQMAEGQEITPSLFITEEHYNQLRKHTGVPKTGDLLMPSICSDGRIFRVINNQPFYFKDGRVLWIKVNESKINSIYLQSVLKVIFRTNYDNIASGTTFAELKIVALKQIKIPVAPYALQTQFAQIVEKTETLKARYQQSLHELENLYGSLSQRAFKGELNFKDEKLMIAAEPEERY